MKCIVGLGNPGKKYEATRHNVGFLALERLVDVLSRTGARGERRKKAGFYEYEAFEFRFGDTLEKIICLKPLTFMNRSGEAVRELVNKNKKNLSLPGDLIVVHDELALPLGRIKVDKDRSSAGHNGVQSIIDTLGTKNFIRIRVGIGQEEQGVSSMYEYVLEKFSQQELKKVERSLVRSVDAVTTLLEKGFAAAQNTANTT